MNPYSDSYQNQRLGLDQRLGAMPIRERLPAVLRPAARLCAWPGMAAASGPP